jgi:hypothetical protein
LKDAIEPSPNVPSEPDDQARREIEAERQRHALAVERLRSGNPEALRNECAHYSFRIAAVFARMLRRKQPPAEPPVSLN